MKILYFLSIFLIMHVLSVFAVEPPHFSEELRLEAQEHLKVEVLHVEQQNFSRKGEVSIYVKARLKVLAVRRSHNGLKYEYQINCNYLHSYKQRKDGAPVPGPSFPPVLEKGQIVTVFLNRIEGIRNTYQPAALGGSFQF